MNILKSFLTRSGFLGMLGLVTLFITGCNDKKSGSSAGPAAAAAFSGAVISFNPTITFTSGTTFSWSNETGDNEALFITEPGSPATGTFTWVPSSDYRTGTLTFTFTGLERSPIALNLSNFSGSATSISSFTVGYNSATYNGRVLSSGSALVPHVTVTIGGGGTIGGGTSGDTIASGTTYNGTIGAVVAGGSIGTGAASLSPVSLTPGSTSFKVSSDRTKLFFNGRTVGLTAGTSAPGFGATGTYALSLSATSVTTFSVIYDTVGVAAGASYTATAMSGSGASFSQKMITQEITIP
ncbi:MAG: hypothetical protein RIQ79_1195 [Verrucomicrobiota bacterium]